MMRILIILMTRYIVVYTIHISLFIIALYMTLRNFPLKQLLANTRECIRINLLLQNVLKVCTVYL